ncbi:hypothetical protein ACFYYR_06485 [Streptomyces sp. NPDC001922]|uniref:hypothetical protein n=1 Tax=Streptomyces sp. NPDC001922 TaxID=3364624 RepID=UPI0036CE6868
MNDSTKAAVAVAVVGGYVLGRTKKAKLAFAVISIVAGRKLPLNPQELLTQGLRKLADTPQFERLSEQVRGELLETGRSALASAAGRSIDSLSDTLHERTRLLKEGEAEEEPEEEEEEEPEEEEEEEEPPERRPARAKAPSGRGTAKAGAAKKTGTAGKKAAKKTPPKKADEKQGAPAKKAASKKTASSKKAAAKKSSARPSRRR